MEGGRRKGSGPKGGGPRFFFPLSPSSLSKHDNPRTERAHLRVPALQTPPKFHEKAPRETQKRNGAGRGEKKILGSPAEGGSKEVQTSNNHNNANRERPARSPKQSLGFVSLGVEHNNTTTPEKFAKTPKNWPRGRGEGG